ncbi:MULTISPECIES: Bug family tripartite tricarboxylate transporter substrate binding protein [unclassified Variovorax]|uniref:Bug family tripartite tricarboxylate transporter substrate binding protein n=1 Tax=unclassified Variovorax TaxID=663243 RepID=UPI000885B49A|nr:tripartite tricarboxylate transporter substrate binding protein [Variovorax sp. CF079]SDE72732.1 Tripartite-type tricarboxylate transporter, receptor component TctC [Variovorax sp. CF079]
MDRMNLRRSLLALALAVSMVAVIPEAQAQSAAAKWPSQPVRFVVPFPAGSAPDVLIRFVGAKLTQKWGQSVVVDNKPGGSGVIGMNTLLTGPTDGTTFGFVQGSAISVAPSTIKGVSYDFNRDFVPVTLAAVAPFVLAVPGDSPYKTLGEFIAAAKAKPQGIEVADNGRGTAPHLASALLGLQSGAQFLEVHYPGGAQAMQATLGGQTKMMVETYNVVAGNVQAGKLRILASLSDRVEPGLEQLPLATSTVPGAVAFGWFAVIAKKGVDPAILAKLNKDMGEALLLPDVVAKSRELGTYPRPGTPDQLAKYIEDDRRTWQGVLDKLNIKPE